MPPKTALLLAPYFVNSPSVLMFLAFFAHPTTGT
tara:strand:+ start:1414 stop:1515 length:102 start_codon:yes stop_codon:yes gene_type:complete